MFGIGEIEPCPCVRLDHSANVDRCCQESLATIHFRPVLAYRKGIISLETDRGLGTESVTSSSSSEIDPKTLTHEQREGDYRQVSVAIVGHGHFIDQAALGIQWHILAMYGPSFITGRLMVRFGEERIAPIGLLLIGSSAAVAPSGFDIAHFWVSLILLGIG